MIDLSKYAKPKVAAPVQQQATEQVALTTAPAQEQVATSPDPIGDVLAKMKANLQTAAPAPAPSITATQVNVPAPAKVATFTIGQPKVSTVSNKLAELSARAKTVSALELQAAQLATTSAKKDAEARELAACTVEVPEEIYTLDTRAEQIQGFSVSNFQEILAKTHQSLVTDAPNLPKLSQLINTNLRQYEELSYLLSPAQLGLIFDVLMKVTGTLITTSAPKKSAAQLKQQVRKEGGLDVDNL